VTRADREFLAGWTFAARVVALHAKELDGCYGARGGLTRAVEGGLSDSPDDSAGQAEAYLAAWGF
jgi:hypothetical protein